MAHTTNERIGFFSGTFDPVHVGHIEFVLQAMEQSNLAKVYMLVEEIPREKRDVTPIYHRVAMLKLAIQKYANIELLLLPVKTFTVPETLPLLQQKAGRARLAYLCGSDIVKTFAYRWPGLMQLVASADILVGLRSGESKDVLHTAMKDLGEAATFDILTSPKPHLASTTIRSGMHQIEDIAPEVAEYIQANKLYS